MSRRIFTAALLTVACLGAVRLPLSADEKKIVALTPADAGPDYALQGEYTGTIRGENGDVRLGLQVIALGKGKFRAFGLPGGLPGDGWDASERVEANGEVADGKLIVSCEQGRAEIRGEDALVMNPDGVELGILEKVHRKSATLGAKPPEGAVVLFDGTSAEAFEKGRIEDGLLLEGTTSKQKFGSFRLHLEFLLSFMPEASGQGRANSGCYMQGRYETQILDSFGLTGEHNECGGIYTVKKPDVNMCFPPLAWQTYDVEFTQAKFDADGKKVAHARMTVKHNGVVIHKDVEVDHATTASPLPEGPGPGPIYLQNHGNPIRFRNIWVVPKE